MIRPRFLARFLAKAAGYFWLPCPICGEDFAGFECGPGLMRPDGTGQCVCGKPQCVEFAEFHNKNLFERNAKVRRKADEIVIDRRYLFASKFVGDILHIVGKHLSDEDRQNEAMREIARELGDHAYKNGVYILTDADRAEAGLPPRGLTGWTKAELWALENRRLEVMLNPTPPMIFPQKDEPK